MTKNVLVVAEGRTEETFINTVLAPALQARDIHLTPMLIITKKTAHRTAAELELPGSRFKGGIGTYQMVRRDVLNVLRAPHFVAVTTMFDYYRLPHDFPGQSDLTGLSNSYHRVSRLEQAFQADIAHSRFRPFLVLHEFEALLFSDPQQIATAIQRHPSIGDRFRAVRNQFNSPEEIDDGPDTHPAARILAQARGYKKTLHGPIIAKRIGLETIRNECPHFAEWLTWLESF